jgi:putative flippase GtrA
VSLLTNRKEQKRFAKFAIVGAIGTLVDYSVFNFVAYFIGFEEVVSQGFSFVAAVISNFILNRNWTFRDSRSKRLRVQLAQYVLVNVIGLIIRTPIFIGFSVFFDGLLAGRALPFAIDPVWLAHNLALAGAIGVVLLWNYFVNRRWTFGDVS